MGKKKLSLTARAACVAVILLLIPSTLLMLMPAAGGIPDTAAGWSYPVRINEPDMADPPSSKNSNLAVDSQGCVHVACNGSQGIHYITNKSGAWTDIQVSEADEDLGAPSIAVDKNGKVYIAYNSNGKIRYVTNVSGSWSDPATASEQGRTPYLAVDSNGKMHIAIQEWWYYDCITYTSNVSGSWTAPKKIAEGSDCHILLDSLNKVHIFCHLNNRNGIGYTSNALGAWSGPAITYNAISVGDIEEVLIDSANKIHIAFYGLGSGRYINNKSGSWSEAVSITGTDSPSGVNIAIDTSGFLHCIYSYETYKNYHRYTRETSSGWSSPVDIPGSGGELEFQVDSGNKPHVIYQNSNRIYYMTDDGPPLPAATWYLAEGSTDWGFNCYISIVNTNSNEVHVNLTYMTSAGLEEGPTIAMPAHSQATVYPYEDVGEADFSTKVTCLENMPIGVDRTMYWTGYDAPCTEAHCATGVTSPATTWFMPEGCSDYGFECYLLIQNPNGAQANCTITWMLEGEDPVSTGVSVVENHRATYNMADYIGNKNASIKVDSDQPIICERAMYRNDRREGHDSTGTPSAAADYYLAEGCTGFGFTTYILVQNPNSSEAEVTITYQAPAGPVEGPTFSMPANSRVTICVNDTTVIPGDDPSFSTHVHGTAPIIAERAMYWNGGPDNAQVCHDSIGLDRPYTNWFLADGQSSEGRETWTLVQNPNDTAVTVEVTYMTPNGTGNVVKTETIPAGSRKSFNMAEHSGINGRAAIMVRCTTPGKKVMCERAMYWNNRGTGTDTIGGYAD